MKPKRFTDSNSCAVNGPSTVGLEVSAAPTTLLRIPISTCWRPRQSGATVVCLLALILLGIMSGTQPILAHDVEISSTEGFYKNQPGSQEGVYQLKRSGDTVTAFFSTTVSPVQHFARQEPTVLLTVPSGFRPAIPITWKLEGTHVLSDGTPELSRPDLSEFHMRLDPDGTMRYVDDSGVDGVGFLRYTTQLAWPGAGAEPRVCERSPDVQARILAALRAQGRTRLYCRFITWEDLAQIRTFNLFGLEGELGNGVGIGKTDDLDGLINLEAADLIVSPGVQLSALLAPTPFLTALTLRGLPAELPVDLLFHTPRLSSLSLSGSLSTIPLDLLAHSPQLTILSLDGASLELPENLLAHTPQLDSLSLRAQKLNVPNVLLVHSPQLKSLSLEFNNLDLPADLLAHTPSLTSLALGSQGNLELPNNLLDYGIQLEHLSLSGKELVLLPSLINHIHHLKTLSLSDENLVLPADWLANTPFLKSLSLHGGHLSPPSDLLASTPELTSFSLSGDRLILPARLLAPAEKLATLSLQGDILNYPSDLLTHTPYLTSLTLHAQRLDLSTVLLNTIPLLTVLNLAGLPVELPRDLLVHTPQLTTLSLRGAGLQMWHPQVLAPTPLLTTLNLSSTGGSMIVNMELLKFTPRLTSLSLAALSNFSFYTFFEPGHYLTQTSLHPKLLAHTPELTSLELRESTMEVKEGFLVYVPKLQRLIMDSWGDPWDLIPNIHPIRQGPLPADFLDYTPELTQLFLRERSHREKAETFRSWVPHLLVAYLEELPDWD